MGKLNYDFGGRAPVNNQIIDRFSNRPWFIWSFKYKVIRLHPPLFNRPGVDGAVLQTPLLLIKRRVQPFLPNLHNIINLKP